MVVDRFETLGDGAHRVLELALAQKNYVATLHVRAHISLVHQRCDNVDVLLVFDLFYELDNAFGVSRVSQSLLQHYERDLLVVKVSQDYILEDNLDGNIDFEKLVLGGEDGREVLALLLMRVGALPSDSILVEWT